MYFIKKMKKDKCICGKEKDVRSKGCQSCYFKRISVSRNFCGDCGVEINKYKYHARSRWCRKCSPKHSSETIKQQFANGRINPMKGKKRPEVAEMNRQRYLKRIMEGTDVSVL